jgi:formate dehydrogenase subunit gamma
MAALLAHLRFVVAALAVALAVTIAAPAGAQQPNSVNPTASSVKEDQLLQELQRLQGRVSIPDARSSTLIQPAGRDWRQFHEVTLRWIAAIAIVGMLALLTVFYLWRGMVKI